jgi:glycosyltransferase involved in cell wall biosynthesis
MALAFGWPGDFPHVKPLVILPSYNSGPRLLRTVREALAEWPEVWVVLDGSTDASGDDVRTAALDGVQMICLPENEGKGGAVLEAMRAARDEGFTHVLVMDADGQHPASMIRPFFTISQKHPDAFLCGVPIFGPDAPSERVRGRAVGNFFATLETLGAGAEDSLFGFRLYPLAPALEVLSGTRWARRFDFDTVLAVRLTWFGLRCINIAVPVCYPSRSEGGVTHFRYVRDNLLLIASHTRLLLEWPLQAARQLKRWRADTSATGGVP